MINVKEFRKKHCKPKLKSRRETFTDMYIEYINNGLMTSGQAMRLVADAYVPTGTAYVVPDNTVLISPEDMNGLD